MLERRVGCLKLGCALGNPLFQFVLSGVQTADDARDDFPNQDTNGDRDRR